MAAIANMVCAVWTVLSATWVIAWFIAEWRHVRKYGPRK